MVAAKDVTPATTWEVTLRTVEGLLRVFDRGFQQELDIPITWYDVLVHLAMAPEGRLRVQALADVIVLQSSGTTRLIDRIEKAGLVRREPAAEDRRGYYVVLTDEGWRVRERARSMHWADIEKNFTKYVDENELHALHSAMSKILDGNPNLSRGRADK